MTWLALPWFVLVTTGSATRMSVVVGAELVGLAALGIPGGAVLRRIGAWRTMVAGRRRPGAADAGDPGAALARERAFAPLVVLAFLLGAFAGPYFAAQKVIVPELIGEDEALVGQASALFQGATRITMLLGPVLGGVLIAAVSAPWALVVDAATYLVSVDDPAHPRAATEGGAADRGGRRRPPRPALPRARAAPAALGADLRARGHRLDGVLRQHPGARRRALRRGSGDRGLAARRLRRRRRARQRPRLQGAPAADRRPPADRPLRPRPGGAALAAGHVPLRAARGPRARALGRRERDRQPADPLAPDTPGARRRSGRAS